MKSTTRGTRVCRALVAVLAANLAATAAAAAAAPAAKKGTVIPATPEVQAARTDLAALRPELERAYAALDAKIRAMPRDRFDPAAIAERVGRDPAALAAWVAAETDLLPYRGALRGSQGVLMDRAGNSLDRSLLLADLLLTAGHEVRLANATLSPDQAQAVAGRVPAVRAHHPSAAAGASLSAEAKQARDRAASHSEQLLKLIGPAAAEASAGPAFAAAVADHWWVQWKDGDKWADADATGVAPAPTPARTVAITNLNGRLPLDAKDCHEVVLSVVIEAYKDGKLATDVVAQQVFRPAEELGRPITLYHESGTPAVAEGIALNDANSAAGFKKSLAAQKVFLPVLKVGPDEVMSASFTTAGVVDREPQVDGAGELAQSTGRTGGNVFGGLDGGSPAASAGAADVLTAEWIEYQIRVPGQPQPLVVRRMVFDLIGPAARAAGLKAPPAFGEVEKLRRALMLAGATQVAIQPCEIPASFTAHQLAAAQLRDQKVYASLAAGEFATMEELSAKLGQVSDTDVPQLVAMARGPVGPSAAATFIDRPNVVHHRTWGEEQPDGTLAGRSGIDLAFTSTAALAPAGPAAFAARLTQGVADTVAEQLGSPATPGAAENTVRLFELAAGQKSAPVVARAPADLAPLGLPADVRARAEADLAAGHVLAVAKAADGRSGWWRVDARTGQTVGVMDNGYHANTTEYPSVQKKGPSRAQYIRQKIGEKRFKELSRDEYMRIARSTDVPADEWAMVEEIQGKVMQKALTCAEQIAKGRSFWGG